MKTPRNTALAAQWLTRWLVLSLAAAGIAAEPPAATPEPPTPPGEPAGQAPQLVRPDELQSARILFAEMAERMRITRAKLTKEALELKQEMGRHQALLAMSQQHHDVLAAALQRLRDREQQIQQDLVGLGADPAGRGDTKSQAILDEVRGKSAEMQARLQRLAGYRTALERRLAELRREHLQRLIQAAVSDPDEQESQETPLERDLSQLLGPPQPAARASGK